MRSTKITVADLNEDLEAGIIPVKYVCHNHIKETHNNSTLEDDGEVDYGKLLIVVRDSGVGLSEENQKRLFHEVVQFNPEV
jgi:signal transduction histidine kinase